MIEGVGKGENKRERNWTEGMNKNGGRKNESATESG